MQGRVNPGWLAAVGTLVLSGAAPGSTAAGPATPVRQDTTLPYERVVDSITYPPPRGAGWVWCTGTPEAARYCFDPHDSTVVRWYRLRVDPDTNVTLTVSSADFDVRMGLLAEGGGRTINYDGAGACNARIPNRRLSRDTLYVLVVGQHLRVPGRFAIDPSVSDTVTDPGSCVTGRVGPRPHSFAPAPSAGRYTVTIGPDAMRAALDLPPAVRYRAVERVSRDTLVVAAWLTSFDGRLEDTTIAQSWSLRITHTTDSLRISVASRRFTPEVYVFGPKAFHAVGGASGSDQSCQSVTIDASDIPAGSYRLVLASHPAGASGAYSVAVGRRRFDLACPTPRDLTRLFPGADTTLPPSASSYLELTRTALLFGPPDSAVTVVVRGPTNLGRTLYVSHGNVVDAAPIEPERCLARLSFTYPRGGLARVDVADSGGAPQGGLRMRVLPGALAGADALPSQCDSLAGVTIAGGATTDSVLTEPLETFLPEGPYVVDVGSQEIDPIVQVVRRDGSVLQNDNGGSYCNARLAVPNPMPGDRLVVFDASGLAARATFHLSFHEPPAPADDSTRCHPPRLPAPRAALPRTTLGSLQLEAPTPGVLQPGAELTDTTYASRWSMAQDAGRAGRWLVLESADFDPYLWIVGPDFILGDDDGGPACSAALPVDAAAIHIIVNSRTPRARGQYLLRLQDSTPSDTPCLTGRYYTAQQLPTVDTVVLRSADTAVVRTGALAAVDAQLAEDSTWARGVLFRVDSSTAGATLEFRLESSVFDPWLIVTGPDRTTREDDDGGGGRNGRIVWTAAPPGEYRIVVNSWGRGTDGLGPYTLRITARRPLRGRQ